MVVAYNRENELRNKLNSFFIEEFSLPNDDYYAKLNLDRFLHLKSILSSINNIFTLKVSLAFVKWTTKHLSLKQKIKELMISNILSTKPNANGYDIELSEPVKLIAEVKCNIPINKGKVYGSAQQNGIKKDIASLISGKTKSQINPRDYLKFMVFLDLPEIRDATKNLVDNIGEYREQITYAENEVEIKDTEKVYIVFVDF
jgi:hypothetical protein